MICVEANGLDVEPPIDACEVREAGELPVRLTPPLNDRVAVRVRICVLEVVTEGITVTRSDAVAEGVPDGVAEAL